MRTLVVGDIHGAYKALVQCLSRAKFNPETDMLISLGDVCDGFPEVKACVDILLRLPNLIYINGNHDEWFYEYTKTGNRPQMWISQGGKATLESYEDGIPDKHRKLFATSPFKYHDEERNMFFCHGGFSQNMKLDDVTPEIFMWNRSLYEQAVRYYDKPRTKDLNVLGFESIFIGHTCTGTQQPVSAGNVWNLDQGAGWNGWLTIMDVDTKEYWQSDNVLDLYPDYNGRFKMQQNR